MRKSELYCKPKIEIEKGENKPSQSSHSTLASVTEDSQPVTPHHRVINRDELIKPIDYEMSQLGPKTAIALENLVSNYGGSSGKRLTDDQHNST